MKLTIQDKMRASSVSRWHIVATSKPQSMAEHSFNVAHIAAELLKRWGLGNHVQSAVYMALNHDLEEVITGDIPTPQKDTAIRGEDWTFAKKAVKIADRLESYTFIAKHYVDRHGQQVSLYCAHLFEESLKLIGPEEANIARRVSTEIMEGRYEM